MSVTPANDGVSPGPGQPARLPREWQARPVAESAMPATGPARGQQPAGGSVDFGWLLQAVLRNWLLIGCIVAGAVGLAAFVLKSLPDLYTAHAEVIIERDDGEFGNLRNVPDYARREVSPAELETHLRLLGSQQLALRVIDRLDLEQPKAEDGFAAALVDRAQGALGGLGERLGTLIGGWVSSGGAAQELTQLSAPDAAPVPTSKPGTNPATAPAGDAGGLDATLEWFASNLRIERDALAHVISIAFRSESPDLAATVSNEVATVFLDELVASQRATLTQTADYLRERVQALEGELEEVELAASRYQTDKSLVRVQGSSAAELRYTELSRELSLAEADLARAAARAGQLEGGIDVLTEASSSPVITDLRRQEAELTRQVAEFSTLYGERHPSMVNARAELADVQASLESERDRLVNQVRTERQVAETRVADLRAQLAELERTLNRDSTAAVELSQFESQSETTRRTYEDLLARYQGATEQAHLLRPPARIISPARPPSKPDGRAAILVLGFTAIGSFAGGVGIALLREMARRTYETADELERETGVSVFSTLPEVARRARRGDRGYALEAGIFVEALQRVTLRLFPPSGSPRQRRTVLTVTSAEPNEGKSMLSVSLATHFAKLGVPTLLIDCDLRKCSILNYFGEPEQAPRFDLVDLLLQPGLSLDDAILRDHPSGCHVLPVTRATEHSVRLLGSPAMGHLLQAARQRYELVILDTPPVLAVNDQAVVSGLADGVLFVVRGGKTRRRAVNAAIREIRNIGLPLLGLVLNRVNIGRYSKLAPGEYLSYHKNTSKYYRH